MRYSLTIFACALVCSISSTGLATEKQFEKLTLTSAVQQALSNNLNLKLQQEDVKFAEGSALAAEGQFDVLFSAEVGGKSQEYTPLAPGGSELDNSGLWNAKAEKRFTTGTAVSLGWNNSSYDTDAQGLLFNPSYNSGLLLGLSQPLMKGFGTEVQTAELRASERQLQAATHQVDSQAADLAAQAKNAYWNLVYSWQDIEVQKFSLTLAEKLLAETEEKIKAGKLARVEIYQPQSEVAKREERLISAERAIGVAEDNLKLLINSEDWFSSYTPVDKPPTDPTVLNLPDILKNALTNRPDIKAADLSIQIAEIQEESATDRLRPDLSLVGNIGLSGTDERYSDSMSNSVSDTNNLWQVGVTFSMPLENSLAKGQLYQAKANSSKARTNATFLRQQIRKTVRTTVRDVELAMKAIEATQKTSFATMKRLEAEQAKFQSGKATTLDVLIAQDAYSQALSQENLTNVAYANTLAELDRIQGLITLSSAP